ncbi:uncharacterized protein LOC134341526 [Mobula hypostoma]|uniref:uncharacterized protein LOC134341526 n=1 Tax=Mobula hypostoma TaxID=723540 RepID=UPI002FC3A370
MLPVFLLVASLVIETGLSESRCLGYDVLCTTADYQFRRYNESVLLGTNVSKNTENPKDLAMMYRFMRGDNSEGMNIQYNGQFLISLSWHRVLAIYMMLPEELWDNPPTPTNPRLFIIRFPMMDVFARNIHWKVLTDASDFNRTLTEQNAHVNNSTFFVHSCKGSSLVGSRFTYGMGTRSFLQLTAGQELWFVATGRFDCPTP